MTRLQAVMPPLLAITLITVPAPLCAGDVEPHEPMVADSVARLLRDWESARLVDLTHAFHPGIPHRQALGDQVTEPLFSHTPGVGKLGDGASLDRHTLIGQWGTHVDPPVHFIAGRRALDAIGLDEMLLPLVVLDIHESVARDHDYVVSMDDVRRWESRHGVIPVKSFVALRTDWSKRWHDAELFFNTDSDGVSHYPGWSESVLRYLDEQRNVTAIGHETADTDPGQVASTAGYPLEAYHLGQDRYQIEMLTNLDKVPEQGAVVIATWPKLHNGSGFPARVIAVCPVPAVSD